MIELTDHNELCVYALSLALHARHAYKYMCVHEIVGVICPPPPPPGFAVYCLNASLNVVLNFYAETKIIVCLCECH